MGDTVYLNYNDIRLLHFDQVTIKKKDAKEGAPPDVVAVLYSGDGFGELALLNDNNLRYISSELVQYAYAQVG